MTPLLELISVIERDIETMERLTPNSDALAATADLVSRLRTSIRQAEEIDVYVDIETLAALSGRPPSTLRRICHSLGDSVGACKVAGAWSVNWPQFEKAIKTGMINSAGIAA